MIGPHVHMGPIKKDLVSLTLIRGRYNIRGMNENSCTCMLVKDESKHVKMKHDPKCYEPLQCFLLFLLSYESQKIS